jgi:flagellar basal-body rod protein FlgF
MSGVVEVAATILARCFQRAEVSAQNLSNMTTPGYKALRWSALVSASPNESSASNVPNTGTAIDFSEGHLQETGNPLDMALSGAGFFVVRSDQGVFYTRDGQFTRGPDGTLRSANGMILQSASGGDLALAGGNPQILEDGTVLEAGQPVAQVGTVDIADTSALRPLDGGVFAAPQAAVSPSHVQIRQGMIETSNVSTAGEMIAIMAALRGAESGQKLMQVYDDVMGRAVSIFGQQ